MTSPPSVTPKPPFVITGLDPVIQLGVSCHPMSSYYVYILASHRHGTLYIGVTNDLVRRTTEHRDGLVEGFTKEHDVKMLVYYEVHSSIEAAIQREKNLKHWSRNWKIRLIEKLNPMWEDMYEEICR